jgi:ABC-type antimicrobial peptide transport system permease subunit
MLQNYLKIALRTLGKHPTTTAIHLLGLTVGLTTCLLIGLFLRNEWGYDRYHRHGERVYRVNVTQRTGTETATEGITPYPLAPALRTEFAASAGTTPTVARIHAEENTFVVLSPEKILPEDRVLFAEPELLDLFDYEFISGNPRAALAQPNQVFLSESTARRYFGAANPVGKTFKLGSKVTVQVAGVVQDPPVQSHLRAAMLVSYPTLKNYLEWPGDQWGVHLAGSTYVRLPENQNPNSVQPTLNRIVSKYVKPDGQTQVEYTLQPLHQIHFEPDIDGGLVGPISPKYLYVFGVVGLFVLLIACINFINLSTARALTRAREVGVRKSVGATGGQLIGQFLGEAGWLAMASGTLALGLTASLLPRVSDFLEKPFAADWPAVLVVTAVLVLLTTLAAGLYPAFVLARLSAVRALKSRVMREGSGTGWLRQGLVVFQFTVSLVLAVGVVVVYQQMKLFRETDLGFKKDAILTVDLPGPGQNLTVLRNELGRLPGVEAVSFGLGAPTSRNNFSTHLLPNPANPNDKVDISLKLVDSEYLRTYGLKLLAGRFLEPRDTLRIAFSTPREERRYVFVVNESTVKALGLTRPNQALGRRVEVGINDIEAEIVGVVRDFNVRPLHEPMRPVVLLNFPYFYQSVGLKLRTTNHPGTVAAIEQIWKRLVPNALFTPKFLDDDLQELYIEEARQFTLLRGAAGLALVICCLGLWGLSAFLIERRTKEIGIRKVLGANVTGIVALLSRDFLKLVGLAFVLSLPLAWYAMTQWLADFEYRTPIGWWVFALVGGLALVVALLTVSFQSVKAALMNPVKSLRTE